MPINTAALATLATQPVAALGHWPTPLEPTPRLRDALRLTQTLLVKRDDAIPFGFGGNKVRKLRYVLPVLQRDGVDTIITCGGVQSNHARAVAAAAAAFGMQCHIIANGSPPTILTGNGLLCELLGATREFVASREERVPGMERAAERLRRAGRRPAIVPLGASTPLGALGFVDAIGELLRQGCTPNVIVHASSSGGTSAGILAGVALHGLSTRVIGISADDPPAALHAQVSSIVRGLESLLEVTDGSLLRAIRPEFDDSFVGEAYAVPTPASIEAQRAAARSDALFVDHTYTAKALAGLAAYCRDGRISRNATVLFWHTGGQPALFA